MSRIGQTLQISLRGQTVTIECIGDADKHDKIIWKERGGLGVQGGWDARLWDMNVQRQSQR